MKMILTLSFGLLAAVSLQGCKEELPYYKQKATTPSPLAQIDEDRRWILMESGEGFHSGCGDLYKNPDNPANTAFIEVCKKWETETVKHLQSQGIDHIERAHLRDPTLPEWINQYAQKILQCKNQHRGLGAAKRLARKKCDPWEYQNSQNGTDPIATDMDFTPLKLERTK